jgi:phenylacetate-coenzyme A ligase PaaK-like adenylate-forming protein
MSSLISWSIVLLLIAVPRDRKTAQEDVVRAFVTAFFSENEKALLGLTTGRTSSDLRSYFWIRRRLLGETDGVPRNWQGQIEILGKTQEKLLAADPTEEDTVADIFRISVDGRIFRCGLDQTNKVVYFSDPPK